MREQPVEATEDAVELLTRAGLAATERVVRVAQIVEAEHREPRGSARDGVHGEQRRVGMALLEVLADDDGLREDQVALLQHRHARRRRVQLVEPRRALREVDLDRLVGDALLGEDDPHAGAVGAPGCVVEDGHSATV
jgi:hypothetical protein